MARTKRTVQLSTGGNARKLELAKLAARKSNPPKGKKQPHTISHRESVYSMWSNGLEGNSMFIRKTEHGPATEIPGEAFESRYSTSIWEYLRKRPLIVLKSSRAYRIGITATLDETYITRKGREVKNDGAKGLPGETSKVSRIFLSDGSGGKVKDQYYGSEKEEGNDWHLILLYSLDCSPVPDGDALVEATQVDRILSAPAIGENEMMAVVQEESGDSQLIDEIDQWCIKNYGKILYLTRGGARASSQRASRYYSTSSELFVKSTPRTKNWCALASVANGIGILEGQAEADSAMAVGPIQIGPLQKPKDMAQTANWVNRRLPGYSLVKVKQAEGGWMEFVLRCREGAYILELHGTENVRHFVSIQAENGRRLIFDHLEEWPMTLCREALCCCVGDGSYLMEIKDVRRITKTKGPRSSSLSQQNVSMAQNTKRRDPDDAATHSSKESQTTSKVTFSLGEMNVSNLGPGKKLDDVTIYELVRAVCNHFPGSVLNKDHDQATTVLQGEKYHSLLARGNPTMRARRCEYLTRILNSNVFLIPLLSTADDHWTLAAVWNIRELVSRIIHKLEYRGGTPSNIAIIPAKDLHKFEKCKVTIYDSLGKNITKGYRSRVKMGFITGVVREIVDYITQRENTNVENITCQPTFSLAKSPQQHDGHSCGWHVIANSLSVIWKMYFAEKNDDIIGYNKYLRDGMKGLKTWVKKNVKPERSTSLGKWDLLNTGNFETDGPAPKKKAKTDRNDGASSSRTPRT